jgi:hypothetical protein
VNGSDCGLSGRQIALNPFPRQTPGKNPSGPRFSAVVIGPRPNRGGVDLPLLSPGLMANLLMRFVTVGSLLVPTDTLARGA